MTGAQIVAYVLAIVAVAEAVALAVLWIRYTRQREERDEIRRRLDTRNMLFSGGREAVKQVWQTANILLFLGPRLGLAPRDASGKLWVHQLQLTLADFIVEIHDTHHPLGGGLYYEEQKPESKRRSKEFLANRLPKYIDYFERGIVRNPDGKRWLSGSALT